MESSFLKQVTSPAVEIVSVEDCKLHAHINNDYEDSIIENWIKAAREEAESYQRRSFISRVFDLSFDGFPSLPIMIPRSPIITIDSVKYYDVDNVETTYYSRLPDIGGNYPDTNSDLFIDLDSVPARVCHAYGKGWPSATLREMKSLIIRFTSGYGVDHSSIPATVKDAIMLYVAYRYENRVGEDAFPKQFYDLLRKERIYL